MNAKTSVLFIDSDQSEFPKTLSSLEDPFGCTFRYATNEDEIYNILNSYSISIIFLDISFIDIKTGVEILRKLNSSDSQILLIAVIPSTHENLTSKIIEIEPFFYIYKPYEIAEIKIALNRAIEKIKFYQKRSQHSANKKQFCGIIGESSRMTKLFDLISKVAEDDFSTVLIRGESGTGKELVAKAIHSRSNRKSKNFVPVNCAAIPDDLLESELFGFTKGAFTGATHNKQGRIQYADEGTLFLDEIGDMKPSLQAKLLRVLQEKEFEPVGGLKATAVDTRILAATHCDLEKLVEEGKFREDLYYRLSVVPLQIPSLKDRREDIPLLINSFILNYTVNRGRDPFNFSKASLHALLRYNWRGNVRELENLIQHMSILYSGKTVGTTDLPEKFLLPENQSDEEIDQIDNEHMTQAATTEKNFDFNELEKITPQGEEIDFNKIIGDFETTLIINALRTTGGNKKEAARLLKLKRTTLLEKIKKKNIKGNY